MKYKIRYRRVEHQKEFQDDFLTKLLYLTGGFGSGKSYSLAMKGFQLSRLNRNIPGGCLVPSYPEFKRDLMPVIEEILDSNGIPFRYHQTDHWYKFPWSSAKMHVVTAERKIRGPTWGWGLVNECTLIEWERIKEFIGRIRHKFAKYPQIGMSGTPEGKSNWDYEHFVETPLANSRIIYGNTRANAGNLQADYIPTLEASYDPVMLDAYLRGLHINMNGNRFYYSYDPDRNDDASLERMPGYEVHMSLDYNVSPMVATLWHVVYVSNGEGRPLYNPDGSQMKRALAFDQIVIEDAADVHKLDAAMRARDLKPETTTIYPDPAGKARNVAVEGARSATTTLKGLGWFKIKVREAAPRIRRRQLGHNNLLAKGLIKIHPKKCKALKKDYEAVELDPQTFEKVKDNPKLTHASDGADYFQDLVFPFSGQKPDGRIIKVR